MIQPQDGAAEVSKVTTDDYQDAIVRTLRFPASEPEDAGITGGTRSLMRRVMGLNVATRPSSRGPARVIGPPPHARIA